MNTETGAVYALGSDLSEVIGNRQLEEGLVPYIPTVEAEHRLRRRLDGEERAALEAMRAGQAVVPISGEVAQQLKVGQRELRRRRARGKAAKQARKRNR